MGDIAALLAESTRMLAAIDAALSVQLSTDTPQSPGQPLILANTSSAPTADVLASALSSSSRLWGAAPPPPPPPPPLSAGEAIAEEYTVLVRRLCAPVVPLETAAARDGCGGSPRAGAPPEGVAPLHPSRSLRDSATASAAALHSALDKASAALRVPSLLCVRSRNVYAPLFRPLTARARRWLLTPQKTTTHSSLCAREQHTGSAASRPRRARNGARGGSGRVLCVPRRRRGGGARRVRALRGPCAARRRGRRRALRGRLPAWRQPPPPQRRRRGRAALRRSSAPAARPAAHRALRAAWLGGARALHAGVRIAVGRRLGRRRGARRGPAYGWAFGCAERVRGAATR